MALESFRVTLGDHDGRRWIVVVISAFTLLFSGSAIFGFPSLQLILEDEGHFAELCSLNDTLTPSTPTSFNSSSISNISCDERTLAFSLAFTVGSAMLTFFALVGGFVLDFTSERVTLVCGGVLSGIGSLLIAFSDSKTFNAFVPGALLIGASAPVIIVALLPAASLIPRHKNTILAIINGAFDSSSIVYALFLVGYNTSGLSHTTSFLIYLILPLGIFPIFFLFWPKEFDKNRIKVSDGIPNEQDEEKENDEKSLFGPLASKNFKFQIKSKEFLFFTIYHSLNITINLTYIGSVKTRLEDMTDDEDLVKLLVTIFSWVFPFALIFSPLGGFVLRKITLSSALILVQSFIITWAVFVMIPVPYFQIVTFLFFVIMRTFYFAVNTAYLSGVFGWKNFGKLFGIAYFVGGCMTFTQFGFISGIVNNLNNEWLIPNIVQLAVCVALMSFPVWCKLRGRLPK